jgi:type I restriction enzyme S subunit
VCFGASVANDWSYIMSVPKLRFPEFRDAGDWEEKILSVIADRITERNNSNSVTKVLSNSAVDGVVDQRDYFEKDIANQDNLQNYFVVETGDYVYNPRVSNTAPVGPISRNKIGKGVMSPLYTVFRFKDKANDFYEQLFKTNLSHKYL